jgi:arginyl-tRNA synthetase
MQVLSLIRQRFSAALGELVAEPENFVRLITPARDPVHGDYQANLAMSLKAVLNRAPREIAEMIVSRLKIDDICQPPEVAGPGFINLRLSNDFLSRAINGLAVDDRLSVTQVDSPRSYVIDYSAPNVAKPMHVGHIRSTVIGDALARMLRFLGHRVVTDNHLGDWGTQFGMIIYGYKHFLNQSAYQREPVAELSRLYRLIQQLIAYQNAVESLAGVAEKLKAAEQRLDQLQSAGEASQSSDPQQKNAQHKKDLAAAVKQLRMTEEAFESLRSKVSAVEGSAELLAWAEQHSELEKRCQLETARLHEGAQESLSLWNQFLPIAIREIETIYHRLDIHFDHSLGESFYHPMLGQLVERLLQQGQAVVSEGAVCLFLPGFDAPMIVRKSDGAFLYATTDLATIEYRMDQFKPDAILYVVDFRQSDHFAKLFAAAQAIGYDSVELSHVSFGTVLGSDGKPFKTRSGTVVGLESLLDEAEQRAYQAVCDADRLKNAGLDMSEAERREIAKIVGIGAIKYADLSHNRTSDYEFNTEKMVSLEGNTSTYIQYMYARTQSILRKSNGQSSVEQAQGLPITLEHSAERALALLLLQLEDALIQATSEYYPNLLANYLYALAKQFATFFENCPVLTAESEAVRGSRVRLCDATGRVLKLGLQLLGIGVVPRM